jgi:hypothetical protein
MVVSGDQKTGSAAMAALLAEATLDLQRTIRDVGWGLCVKHEATKP